jgi:hypothetical protein
MDCLGLWLFVGLMLVGSITRRLITSLSGELVGRFDVMAALLKTEFLRDVTHCRVSSSLCFIGSCLHVQG